MAEFIIPVAMSMCLQLFWRNWTLATISVLGTSIRRLFETHRHSRPSSATLMTTSWKRIALTMRLNSWDLVLSWSKFFSRENSAIFKLISPQLFFRHGKYFLETNSNMFSLSRGKKGLVHTPTKVTCLPQSKQGTCENKFFWCCWNIGKPAFNYLTLFFPCIFN